jgi:hypothetical protein
MNAIRNHSLVTLLCVALVAGGCQHPPTRATASESLVHANACSLLHDLLDQQKNVGKLLLVKRESEEVGRLIKAIAAASAAGAKQLEFFAAQDSTLPLDQLSLPPGEVATRDAIARTKTKTLLTPFSSSFEFNLLLTQTEALSYAWHLAKVAAKNDPQTARSSYLSKLGDEMEGLHRQTLSLMHHQPSPSGKRPTP